MVCIGRLWAWAVETKTAQKDREIARQVFIAFLTFLNLPNNLQGKLNLPCRSLGQSDAAESGNRLSGRADDLERPASLVCGQCRRRKVGAIQDVEKLRAELDIEGLRDLGNVIVLHHGEIDVKQPRS